MPRQLTVLLAAAVLAASVHAGAAEEPAGRAATLLRKARQYVEKSDRYLHHSRLKDFKTGYGLTVMSGTEPVKFDVEILSVLENWYPHQDVILCRLKGLNLDKSGIIAGMSGSPVFVTDPADGKDKMIGAVAYGWEFQNDPICGVQPITQMLAVEGLLEEAPAAPSAPAQAHGGAPVTGRFDAAFLRQVLDRRSRPTLEAMAAKEPAPAAARAGAGRAVPLATPVMMSGGSPATWGLAETLFAGARLRPVQSGTVASAQRPTEAQCRLAPGSAVAVPLVAGDMDWSAVGTVTECIGDRVLAFGHSFNSEGPCELPMGPATIHTVISSAWSSFKLGSTLALTGCLTTDENTAIAGCVGQKARMIPMTVHVAYNHSRQTFRYEIVRHRFFTPRLAYIVLRESVLANRDLPELHAIDYSLSVAYGPLGTYRAANLSSGRGLGELVGDLDRMVFGLCRNDLTAPVFPESIELTVQIEPKQRTADIVALDLDRHTYRPGQTVRAKVTLEPFRSERITVPVTFDLPADLPEGPYTLTVQDGYDQISSLREESPHHYDPRTVPQLFSAIQKVAEPRMDRLYLRVPVTRGGAAVRKQELPDLPPSVAALLSRTAPHDVDDLAASLKAEVASPYVVSGSADAGFVVEKAPGRAPARTAGPARR